MSGAPPISTRVAGSCASSALIYLIAFLSFWVQVDGLIGARGLTPVPQLLTAAHAQLGGQAYFALPTLCWLNSSNAFLHFLCGAGAVLSLLLIAGIAPILCLVLLFASLSFAHHRGADVLQFSMGYPAARDGISRHLPRALALVAEARPACAAFARRAFPPPFSSLQTDADVRRGEAHERRRIVGQSHRARLSLLDAAAADRDRVVGRQVARVVQAFLDRFRPRRGNRGRLPYLAAAPAALARLRRDCSAADRDWPDRQLRILQSPYDRALPPPDRRCRLAGRASPNESAGRGPALARLGPDRRHSSSRCR